MLGSAHYFLLFFRNIGCQPEMNRYIAIVTLLFLSLLLSPAYPSLSASSAAQPVNFYFYYPDSILTNLSRLTQYIGLLFKKGPDQVLFQAFHHKVDFDRMFKITQPSLVLLPEWYYRDFGKELGITPVLTPTRDGKAEYTKVLLVQKHKPLRLDELSDRTLAMTPLGPNAVDYLNNDLFNEHDFDFSTCRITTVGKDANALFALVLGQVDAAIVGTDTLSLMWKMNRKVVDSVKVLAKSQPVPMPLLCVLNEDKANEEVTRITQLILDQAGQQALPEVMELLNIDGWQKITH